MLRNAVSFIGTLLIGFSSLCAAQQNTGIAPAADSPSFSTRY